MIKTTLKLGEILALSEEVHGLQDRQNGAKIQNGLLDEEISLVQKYWLGDLGKKTKEIADEIAPLRDDLIKKYGETSADGSIGISAFVDEKNENGELVGRVPNPKWEEFQKEYGDLLDQTKEIDHYEFPLYDFSSVRSKNRYSVFLDKIVKP